MSNEETFLLGDCGGKFEMEERKQISFNETL